MTLTVSDISRIARLARLELSDNDKSRYTDQLNAFFDVVEAMRAVDTTGIEPLAHPVAVYQDVVLRLQPDSISETNQREDNQRNAAAIERGLFLVPKVIE
jgi:aspartyl-tRNA(Asn)/glutamyl-tRNA(Gln) amidotransferase subunit C